MELDTEQLQALIFGLPWQRVGAASTITLLEKTVIRPWPTAASDLLW